MGMGRPKLSCSRPTKGDLFLVVVVTILLGTIYRGDFSFYSGPIWTGLGTLQVGSSLYPTCSDSQVPPGQGEVFAFLSGTVVSPTGDTTDGKAGSTIAKCKALCVEDPSCTGFAFYNPDGACYTGAAEDVHPASDFSGFLKGTCGSNTNLAGLSGLSSACCNYYFAGA